MQTRAMIFETCNFARRNGSSFNLAYMDDGFLTEGADDFDTDYTRHSSPLVMRGPGPADSGTPSRRRTHHFDLVAAFVNEKGSATLPTIKLTRSCKPAGVGAGHRGYRA